MVEYSSALRVSAVLSSRSCAQRHGVAAYHAAVGLGMGVSAKLSGAERACSGPNSLVKVNRLSARHESVVVAVTVAERISSLNSAISPKKSPVPDGAPVGMAVSVRIAQDWARATLCHARGAADHRRGW